MGCFSDLYLLTCILSRGSLFLTCFVGKPKTTLYLNISLDFKSIGKIGGNACYSVVSEAQETTATVNQSLAKEHTHQSEESPMGNYLTVIPACRHRYDGLKKKRGIKIIEMSLSSDPEVLPKATSYSFILAFPVCLSVQVLIIC